MYDLLSVELRNPQKIRPFQLRKQGMIPGVLFAKGMESIPIQLSRNNLKKILSHGVKVFEVEVAAKEKHLVNLEHLQRDPVTHEVLHISFHKLKRNQTTHVSVPVKLEGKAIGTTEGGVVRQLLDEVMITGLPHKIPEFLIVDVQSLAVGDHINVQDIKLDHGLSFDETDLENAIVNCAIPKVVEEPTVELTSEEIAEAAAPEAANEADGKEEETPTEKAA